MHAYATHTDRPIKANRCFFIDYLHISMNWGYLLGDVTTIKIRKETRDRLAEIGSKRETYDQILNYIMEFYEKHNREKGVRK